MEHLETLLESLPPEANDLRVNLKRVLTDSETLGSVRTWGVALASAYFIGNPGLVHSLAADAKATGIASAVFEDARGAASLMGMNTVYFRFRHFMGAAYERRPPNLRMTRMKQVSTSVVDFELFSIGPAAIAGCEMCLKAHEAAVLKGGLSEDAVHDAVRIAAVLQGVSVGLGIGAVD